MEDRNIKDNRKRLSHDISYYEEGVLDLKATTLEMADYILSKSPQYWEDNAKEVAGIFEKLDEIKSSGHGLDAKLDSCFPSCDE